MGDIVVFNKVDLLFKKPPKYFIYRYKQVEFLGHVETINNSIIYFNAVGLEGSKKRVRINESISVIERRKHLVTCVVEDLSYFKPKYNKLKKLYEDVFFHNHLL